MLSEEKYYNKIMKQDKMSIEEAENIIDEMYQDKYKIIEANNTIYVDRLDEVKFTNLEFASVRMLREVQSLRRKLEKLQKEADNYIPKEKIREKIKRLIQKLNESNDDRWEKDDNIYYDKIKCQIRILKELLEGDRNESND